MRGRHPVLVLLLCWFVFVALVVAADCLLRPAAVTLTEAPTRVPLTVQAESTVYVFITPTPLSSATEVPILPTSTRRPIVTTTATPTPALPTVQKPMVQRG